LLPEKTALAVILEMRRSQWGELQFPTSMSFHPGKFFHEVKTELHKATWPWDPREKGVKRYKELIDSTVVVLIAMTLLGGFVALWDLVFMALMELLNGL